MNDIEGDILCCTMSIINWKIAQFSEATCNGCGRVLVCLFIEENIQYNFQDNERGE